MLIRNIPFYYLIIFIISCFVEKYLRFHIICLSLDWLFSINRLYAAKKIIINGNNVTIVLSPVLFLWQQFKVQCKIKNAKNMNTSDDTITRYFNIQIVGEHEQVRKLTSTHLFTNRHAHHNQHHQKQQPCLCNAGQ